MNDNHRYPISVQAPFKRNPVLLIKPNLFRYRYIRAYTIGLKKCLETKQFNRRVMGKPKKILLIV